mmetsp:Transcript_10677/g.25397  ORF Transcript_10677/g.25397 Transcript_10677/m.25397 type:complete len:335 (-) Transcript_10677:5-1009(-)
MFHTGGPVQSTWPGPKLSGLLPCGFWKSTRRSKLLPSGSTRTSFISESHLWVPERRALFLWTVKSLWNLGCSLLLRPFTRARMVPNFGYSPPSRRRVTRLDAGTWTYLAPTGRCPSLHPGWSTVPDCQRTRSSRSTSLPGSSCRRFWVTTLFLTLQLRGFHLPSDPFPPRSAEVCTCFALYGATWLSGRREDLWAKGTTRKKWRGSGDMLSVSAPRWCVKGWPFVGRGPGRGHPQSAEIIASRSMAHRGGSRLPAFGPLACRVRLALGDWWLMLFVLGLRLFPTLSRILFRISSVCWSSEANSCLRSARTGVPSTRSRRWVLRGPEAKCELIFF